MDILLSSAPGGARISVTDVATLVQHVFPKGSATKRLVIPKVAGSKGRMTLIAAATDRKMRQVLFVEAVHDKNNKRVFLLIATVRGRVTAQDTKDYPAIMESVRPRS